MKAAAFDGRTMTRAQMVYLKDNLMDPSGVRHYVLADSTVEIHGQYFTAETLDIERQGQHGRRQRHRRSRYKQWRSKWAGDPLELPLKRRRYRIRLNVSEREFLRTMYDLGPGWHYQLNFTIEPTHEG